MRILTQLCIQVLELLIDIAQSEGQQDSPFGAALLVGVPVSLCFLFIFLMTLTFSFTTGFPRNRPKTTAASPPAHAAAGSVSSDFRSSFSSKNAIQVAES